MADAFLALVYYLCGALVALLLAGAAALMIHLVVREFKRCPGTCQTCRFWEGFSDLGFCHRGPPSLRCPRYATREVGFATSYYDDWCGEHEAGLPPQVAGAREALAASAQGDTAGEKSAVREAVERHWPPPEASAHGAPCCLFLSPSAAEAMGVHEGDMVAGPGAVPALVIFTRFAGLPAPPIAEPTGRTVWWDAQGVRHEKQEPLPPSKEDAP